MHQTRQRYKPSALPRAQRRKEEAIEVVNEVVMNEDKVRLRQIHRGLKRLKLKVHKLTDRMECRYYGVRFSSCLSMRSSPGGIHTRGHLPSLSQRDGDWS